jgi:hypothetical protein
MNIGLSGPKRFINQTGEIRDLKHTDIEDATIQLKGEKYNLLQNNIKVSYHKDKNEIFVYHMYDYLDNNYKRQFGRWYKWFKTLPIKDNKFVFKMEEYEDEAGKNIGPAIITINFTCKASQNIQKIII